MHYTSAELKQLPRIPRLNLLNSVSGIKPANLIGTISKQKETNLAIFSSVVHLGSDPALLGFVLRPEQEVRRHTYENLLETGVYTINHVHESFIAQAHYTSARFEKEESEFAKCGLSEEYLFGFEAPFVKESPLKMGLRFCEEMPIRRNNTHLIIGEIEHLVFPEEWMDAEGHLNLEGNTVGISGLNSYYSLARMAQFPYARAQEVPGFSINPLNRG